MKAIPGQLGLVEAEGRQETAVAQKLDGRLEGRELSDDLDNGVVTTAGRGIADDAGYIIHTELERRRAPYLLCLASVELLRAERSSPNVPVSLTLLAVPALVAYASVSGKD